ncbi:tau 95 subunit of transcription factor TFIIIC, partial [Coemansia nantahalensis]
MAGQRGKMAERRALPERTMLAVEYPGYVVDTAKALRSLGGSKKLARDTTEDVGMPVELRFRYEDPASHPINGEITPTENLLLKVTRRVRRRRPPQTGDGPAPAEEEEAQVRAEVVA